MNSRKLGFSFVVIAIVAIFAIFAQAATITEPTTFRDRVVFRGSTGPDFDTDNKFSIGGTKVTKTAAELNAVNAGASITGNIPVASITNAAGSVGASIGGNIPVAAITNAAGSVGASIGGNIPEAALTNAAASLGDNLGGSIPVACITNALAGTAYTTNTLTGDGVTNVFIFRTVGTGKIIHSITTTP